MMLLQSGRHRALAISLLSCCVLFSKPTKMMAAPAAEPDLPSMTVAPEACSRDQQVKLGDAPGFPTAFPLSCSKHLLRPHPVS